MSAVSNSPAKVSSSTASLLRSIRSTFLNYDSLKTFLFWYVVWVKTGKLWRHVHGRGLGRAIYEVYLDAARFIFSLILRYPPAKRRVESQMNKTEMDLEKKIGALSLPESSVKITHLPSNGMGRDWVSAQLDEMHKLPATAYLQGRASGAVYHGGEDLSEVIREAFAKYTVSNPLHPDVFPGIRKMEAEVVAMCLQLFNAPTDEQGKLLGAGTTTSGGTESIIMACKTYRDWGRNVRGITEPEMVIPESAHPAFLKGAYYFGIKAITIPVNEETRRVQVKGMKRAINRNTIMIVGSAPNFPDGAIDDISTLSALAKRKGLPLHVDCCLGSFLMPFLEKAGYQSEPFDFRLQGVTSISCDTHKYGFAPKGSSVIMYRSKELRNHQYFIYPNWSGGLYASPSIAGSRPGSLIAGTWATMVLMGEDGYLESCRSIVGAAKKLEASIRADFPELYILGKPLVSVVAFGGQTVDIYQVGDILSKKGWHLNALQNPPALHLALTRLTVPVVEEFLAELREAVDETVANPAENKGDMVALYGLGRSSAAGPGLVSQVAGKFLDVLYSA